ncbi:hypothetical protein PAP_09390 [Palaeococcus pacificus DY20341]|uniref:Tryptophan synthase beta chain-like PALP domain-containing protein n=1 Tax=Palaeococcus pacificus DY20341 TaxID=1343739 RepID=A0A075LV87_9EURY|nr:pyridoxal-phosphate dependent enzyme [Palaeococcus pacificus]AIF70254.1 hypothetical protein PAP_09390 [Palaeococcus pacificus DY20341]
MLKCQICKATYPDVFRLKCDCGGLLDVVNEFEKPLEDLLNSDYLDIRRYLNLLPVNQKTLPSLTPPITPVIERKIEGMKVLFKLEYLMPSGSFKDRGTYVTVAKLKEEGIKEISLDSSGNAAISFALFGKAENIRVHVFIPKHTSEGKKKLLRLLKAEIHEIDGSRMEVHEKAQEFKGATYVSHWYNPYFLEGTKLTAYEAFEQIGEVEYVIIPTGSGSLFLGLYKGFKELERFGKIKKIPKLIAVQAKGFESLGKRSKEKNMLGEGIAIPEPPRKEQIKSALKESKGVHISVSEEETKKALEELRSMGFIVEATSAVGYAGFKLLLKKELLKENSKTLMPLTGSGFKSLTL